MINSNALLEKFSHQSYESVLGETLDAYIVDMSRCITYLDPVYANSLKQPPLGVYVNGSIEPSLVFDGRAYFTERRLYENPEIPDVVDYTSFLSTNGAIYDASHKAVFFTTHENKKRCTPLPSFNYAALHVAFIAIYDYFNLISTVIKPWTDVDPSWLKLENFVKDAYLTRPIFQIQQGNEVYIEAGDASFHPEANPLVVQAIDEIHRFVGRHKNNFYRLRLNNMTLVIERGHDARTIDYHRLINSHMESIQHEHIFGICRL